MSREINFICGLVFSSNLSMSLPSHSGIYSKVSSTENPHFLSPGMPKVQVMCKQGLPCPPPS